MISDDPGINDERELIRRAQAHDTDAFCALAERYTRRVYLLAFHYCRNAQDAEDLSQEVWLKAYQALNTFRSEASFYTWLRRITINTFINHQRSRSILRQGQTTIVQLLAVDSQAIRTRAGGCILHSRTSCRVLRTASETLCQRSHLKKPRSTNYVRRAMLLRLQRICRASRTAARSRGQ